MNSTPPRIAVVDDEESVRKAVERLLRSAGMVVEIFPSGAEFLDAVRSRPIDCVVLDLHMEGINGFEVQANLLRSGKWLPIIVMTGHDTPAARARALAGGVVAYLLKPVDEQLLLETIETAIDMKQV
jgi:FixJ family two-component response regulator